MIEQSTAAKPASVSLPFAGFVAGRLNLWVPEPSGSYAADCAKGREYAAAAIEHMARTGDYPLLGRIVLQITKLGRFGGLEIGFMSAVAIATSS